MANTDLTGKYFVRRSENSSWEDLTTKFNGIKVLSVDGFNEVGDAVNVYTEQWVNNQSEDFLVTTQDGQQNDVIIRKNVDLDMTLIISRRYQSGTPAIDEQTVYDNIVNYINGGAFYIKSAYVNKQVKVICTKSFKPTTQKLQRGLKSYILVTIPLHTLDKPTAAT